MKYMLLVYSDEQALTERVALWPVTPGEVLIHHTDPVGAVRIR